VIQVAAAPTASSVKIRFVATQAFMQRRNHSRVASA
jgi:hypothetical protein